MELTNDSCIGWHGTIDAQGYGACMVRGTRWKAHRLVYTECFGPIPEKRDVHHVCGNRACINPAHLLAVTRREHVLIHDSITAARAASNLSFARRTHCHNGHAYLPNNFRIDGRGRRCRTCERENQRRYQARKKAASGAA